MKAIQKIILLKKLTLSGKEIAEMSDEDLVDYRNLVKSASKELAEMLIPVDDELFERADSYPGRKYGVGNDTVLIISRPNFNYVPLSYCKKKNATKLVPDSDVLKVLWQEGKQIPEVKITEYVTVKK